MSKSPHRFKLNDAARFMRAHAKAAGLPVERLRYVLDPSTGRITGDVRNEGDSPATDDLDQWMAKRGKDARQT